MKEAQLDEDRVLWDWIWLEQFHSFLVSFHPPPLFFFEPTSSSLFLCLSDYFPSSPLFPLNYGSGCRCLRKSRSSFC